MRAMPIRRDDVLAGLRRRGRPALSAKALLKQLGGHRGQMKDLRRVLRELQAEGAVERVDGRYRAPRQDGLLEGIFGALPGRGGQVVTEGGETLRVPDAGEAREGDRVLVQPRSGRRGAADVVAVLATRRQEWVGILSREPTGGRITPYRDDAQWGLGVAKADLGGARDGDVVVAVPRRARGRAGEPTARVVEVLGPPGEPEADFRAVVWRRRLPLEFPEKVLAEAEAPEPGLSREERDRRVDLTDRFFLTIDPATARDHDDAVCVEPLAEGEGAAAGDRLWVAIADVSHYVPEGSALDREALRRGNSVYFPDRAIPMLPERLSGDLCSLRTGVERPVMCVELEVDGRGRVSRRSFYPAVIRSRAGLDYERAAEVMEERGDAGLPPEGVAQLRRFAAVARRLERRRFAAGSIDFDLPSAEIVLGDAGHPVDIVEQPRTVAHRAIEEAMLAANRAVAETLAAARVPTLYRIHEPPAPADIEELEDLLGAFGLLGPRKEGPLEPRDVARALQKVAGHPEERLVNVVTLRAMRQARYATRNQGHFALAFELYCHFTSPIRRYADLVVHRALRDLLAADEPARRRAEARGAGLDLVATRVSQRERVAEVAEREMVDLKKCAFMAQRVGEEYDGTITGVARHGFYVTLDPFFVEGLVHVATLKGYAVLDERSHALVIRGTRERFRLGDRVHVLVDAVDQVKAWINLSLLGRLPRNGGREGSPQRPQR